MAPAFFEFLYSQLFITPPYPEDSFSGKIVIVTGATAGLGREAARHIVCPGASKVIIAGRNSGALEEARKDITGSTHCADSVLEAWLLDLCSYESDKAFARKLRPNLLGLTCSLRMPVS